MDNSWNNQHFQHGQPAGQIRFFDPSQFQTPAASIANPSPSKFNSDTTQSVGNVGAGNVQHHSQEQQHPSQPQPQGNAWGGQVGNDVHGAMPQAQSSWTNWGSWDWNQDQNGVRNEQQDAQHYQPFHQQQQHMPQTVQPQQPQVYSADNTHNQDTGQYQEQHMSHMPAADSSGEVYAGAYQYNNAWDASGQYAPQHQNYAGGQDMQHNQSHLSYYGDHNAYSQNQYVGDADTMGQQAQPQQQQVFSDIASNQMLGQGTDYQDPTLTPQIASSNLDQGQSQVLYDQPSVSQNEYEPSSFTNNGPWLDNSQHSLYHHQDGVVQRGGVDGAEGNVNHGQSNELSLLTNASPSNNFSIPVVVSSQSLQPSLGEPPVNEYCDNDSDGGTVAGFFGRGDDDGDVSSDAQRPIRPTANTSVSDSASHGPFLNVGKQFARENSEISNASLSTLNMSVEDDGKEHLNDLQALVQRMESIGIANRQIEENKTQGAGPENVPSEFDHQTMQQSQTHGDFSGFGNESSKHTRPPPTLPLETNTDRPSSPDGMVPTSSESGGSGGSGGSSGLTDWEIVPLQSQMTHSRNSSLDNSISIFSDKPDGSINEPQRESKDGGVDRNLHHNHQSSQSFNSPNEGVNNFQNVNLSHSSPLNQSSDSKNDPASGHSFSSHEQFTRGMGNLTLSLNSVPPPPQSSGFTTTVVSSSAMSQPALIPDVASFQPGRSPHIQNSPKSIGAVGNSPPNPNPVLSLVSNDKSGDTKSTPDFDPQKAKSIPSQPPRPKMASDDGARPANRKELDQRSSSNEQSFRRPRDPAKRESEDKVSLSSQRRHQSAFHPVHRPRQNTVSPALWETDSGSSSNILLAPAMPLIIPALNPYSSSAAATATTNTSTTASVSKASPSTATSSKSKAASKELEDQTPRSRYGDRNGDREKGRDERPRERERDREDTNRSFDSLDELDSDYRTPRDQDKSYKSERPGSRSERSQYDRPLSRSERPSSRTEGYKDPYYRRNRGYYADSYYDEQYDRPRSRHDEAKNNSRPSSRSGQEMEGPRSRGDYDRDREYGYRDKNRGGYNYDGYGRSADYYNDERERYYRYYRDRDARYSRGYYEEYYGAKNADYYLQQQQQKQQDQQQQKRPTSRSQESDGPGSRSQSRGNTPGPEQSADYYSGGTRPQSRNDYARDYYARGYGYDYSGYYDGYGYDPYAYSQGYFGYEEAAAQQGYEQGRMTPPKYTYPHVRACFGPKGQLVKVLPNRPSDGQPAVVELLEVQSVLESCQEADDLKQFPGPLTRDGSHKKDVLLFCQQKARECMEDVDMMDRESAQLVWKLLELLIKQNGSVVGTDLSDLLLDGHEPGVQQYNVASGRISQSTDVLERMTEDSLEGDGSSRNSPAIQTSADRTLITPSRQREDCIARFRHLLLYGRKKDAIECAMKHNLWGHALFLASKMDTRTHASVMIRFANSAMRMNDPLQTLYQLMSGRQPASVTCVVDERWGDWRPHLAMILSNQTSRQDLDRKSITTLGDTLAAKGCLHASHFCYLMAQVPFGTYDKKTSKIVLIGANHYLQLREFAAMEAIQCTEVYEYAQTLNNPSFCLPHFQLYKYLYACRLVDFGMATEALMYCEVITSAICCFPAYFQPSFAHLVFELASKLKYSDPQRQNNHVDENEDPVWIQQLVTIIAQYEDGSIQPVSGTMTPADMQGNMMAGHGGVSLYQQGVDNSSLPGEAQVQNSGSTGFDMQGVHQYSQQPVHGDYSTGQQSQYYNQDSSGFDQQQQQYPGYDETDASHYHQPQHQDGSVLPQGYDPQQHQPPQHRDGSVQQGYEQQQHHDYSQWQQQPYAGYQYMGYELDTQQPPQHVDSQPSSSSSSASTSVLPSSIAQPRPSFDQGGLVEDTGHQTDLTSSQTSSGFSGSSFSRSGASNMALPPRASVSTNETEEDDDDDDDEEDAEGGGVVTGFDYFANPGNQRVVAPPHRYRTTSESSSTGGRRRRTTSGSSTGSVKASPHKPPPPQSSKSQSKQAGIGEDSKGGNQSAGGGWFGGLFSKFGRKGKNEMILPDDKDPAILWDSQKKKWVNADGTEDEVTLAAPPPKDIDLISGKVSSTGGPTPSIPGTMTGGGMPPPAVTAPPGANKFSLKAKTVRNQYVDLNNPKPVAAPQGLFNVTPPFGNGTASNAVPQVFMPGSINPSNAGNDNNNDKDGAANNLLSVPVVPTSNDLSRSSSMSSVNQEVQQLTGQIAPDTTTAANHQPSAPSTQAPPLTNAMPMLFNPASLTTSGVGGAHSAAGPGLKYGQRRAYPKK